MSKIKVNELNFELILNSNQIQVKVKEIAAKLEKTLSQKDDITSLVIMDGAFMFASDLLRNTNLEMNPHFITIKSYIGENQSSKIYIDQISTELVFNKTIVIIEDIIDSGNSMLELCKKLKDLSVKEIYIVAFIIKDLQIGDKINVDFYGFNVGPEFIIGYGMDYNGCGRGLDCIYQKII